MLLTESHETARTVVDHTINLLPVPQQAEPVEDMINWTILSDTTPVVQLGWREAKDGAACQSALDRGARIDVLSFYTGVMAVGDRNGKPTTQEERCLMLASAGLEFKEIAKTLGISHHTVKRNLHEGFAKHNIPRRTAITRRFMETGFYTPRVPGMGLWLKSDDLEVLDLISRGLMQTEVAAKIYVVPPTVKKRVQRIIERNGFLGLRNAEQLVMVGLMSGQLAV